MSSYKGWHNEPCWICPEIATHTYNRYTKKGQERTFVCEYHALQVSIAADSGKVTELEEFRKWRKRANHPTTASPPPSKLL